MSHRPTSMHSITGAATTTAVRRSCRAAATASAAAAAPKRRSNRAAAAAAYRAMQESPIELSSDESGDISDQHIEGNSRENSRSDYDHDHSSRDSSGSDSSEEEVSYTDSLKKANAADADMADVTSPHNTPLQHCKRPGSFADWLACKKAKQAVRSVSKANSGAAATQSPADSADTREKTVPLEDAFPAAPDGSTDSQVDTGPCAEPQAQHGSQQTVPTSAARMLAPSPPSAAGGRGSEAQAASVDQPGAAVTGVTAGVMSMQPPPAAETTAPTQGAGAVDAAGEVQDEIAGDPTTAAAVQLQGEATPALGGDWAEAPGKGRKLNLNLTASGNATGRNIYVPKSLIKQMTGQEEPPNGLRLHTTLFRDGHQLGPILERTLNRPSKLTLTTKSVECVINCTITKLRAKEPNFFEVYFVTDTSQPASGLTSGAPAPAAATPSGNTGQPESTSSEQAPASFGPVPTRQQEATTEAAATTAPALDHDESGGCGFNTDTTPQSDPMQAVAAAVGAAAADAIAPATAALSQEPAAALHGPTRPASTSTVAATPATMDPATPEGAYLLADYNMAPYKTVPQAVMELIPLLGFMKAPKAVRCQFRAVFAALKLLQEGDHDVEMFKADYKMLAWVVEHKDVDEIWSALGELLRTATRAAGAHALV